jgi:hypothetical protein
VSGGERAQRGELDHRHGLALEQHGQDQHAPGRGAAEAGVDLRIIRGHVVQQDALLFRSRLAYQADAEADRFRLIRALRVACEQSQVRLHSVQIRALAALHLIDGALLRVDQRGELGE